MNTIAQIKKKKKIKQQAQQQRDMSMTITKKKKKIHVKTVATVVVAGCCYFFLFILQYSVCNPFVVIIVVACELEMVSFLAVCLRFCISVSQLKNIVQT